MKRLDEGKASLVDFLRSIKFTRETSNASDRKSQHCGEHFAGFNPQIPTPKNPSAEDSKLVRSAN
ncbi:MAG: hypothetical protein OSA45_05235 [Halioglobus sp.]|nr:hypothetical protein [Halioglobus sp.]